MAQLVRWQWMWKSRLRLLALGSGVVAIGNSAILFALTRSGPFNKAVFLILFGGVWILGVGGYQILQGLFSPAGAFGDHDAKEKPYRHKRRPVPEQDPLPLSSENPEPD